MDAKDNFDPSAWQEAYNDAGLTPEAKQVKSAVKDLLKESGIAGQVMSASEAVGFWDQQEKNKIDLIHAELGDETFVMLNGENYSNGWDLAGNRHSFPVYIGKIEAYIRKGDEESVEKLLSVIPEGSTLRKEIYERVKDVEEDPNYPGFDGTDNMGKITSVNRGTRYDLQPGVVDFRKYVDAGKVDIERISTSMLDNLDWSMKGYSEFWDELSYTLDNVRKEFGDDTREEIWKAFEQKYRKLEAEHEPKI